MSSRFSASDLTEAIRAVGLCSGDIAFSHVGLGLMGMPLEATSAEDAFGLLLDAFEQVLGPDGTLIIPTFSYSFCKGQTYNPDTTQSDCGPFSEFFRLQPDAIRSLDPIFSVAAKGARARELLSDLPKDCFGVDSVFDRIHKAEAKLCNIGVGVQFATFVHHIEQICHVPYRYKKLFPGTIERGGESWREGWIYNVGMLGTYGQPDLQTFESDLRSQNLVQEVQLGRSSVTCSSFKDIFDLCAGRMKENPSYLAAAPESNYIEAEQRRVGKPVPDVSLSASASAREIVDKLTLLERDIISDGYDAALLALNDVIKMQIHKIPTGTECWSWLVPEKWSCKEAYLEDLKGNRIFSYNDHPLHVVSYSQPFSGKVGRDELFKHLHTHWELPDAIPFIYKYYERDWGLCCTQNQKDSLKDDEYIVKIDSHFSFGELKVGEAVLQGESEKSIVLCNHLCHPGIASDGLLGVVACIDLMRWLSTRERRRYTYRMIICPETIGSIAYLATQTETARQIIGGIVTEWNGLVQPHYLHLSFDGDSEIDRIFKRQAQASEQNVHITPFHGLNDERHFNAPGMRIPVLALYRYHSAANPYPSYHSSADNHENIDWKAYEQSLDLLKQMILALEEEPVPVPRFSGELFLSRFGLPPSGYYDAEARTRLFDIIYQVDGQKGVSSIAQDLELSMEEVWESLRLLESKGLITYL